MQLTYLSFDDDPAYLTGASVTFLVALSSQFILKREKNPRSQLVV